jgi:hypothetical protein
MGLVQTGGDPHKHDFVLGRLSYAIYDMSGLPDINTADVA